MSIIALSNQKGGTAKTTIAIHLAEMLALKNDLKVVLYDADPQGSAVKHEAGSDRDWAIKVHPRASKDVVSEIYALEKIFDVVVVDTRPDISEDTLKAVGCADLVVFPIKPGGYELDAMDNYVAAMSSVLSKRPDLVVKALHVFADSRKMLGRYMTKQINQSPYEAFETRIPMSEVFNQITVTKELIFDLPKTGMVRKIHNSFKLLTDEVTSELIKIAEKK